MNHVEKNSLINALISYAGHEQEYLIVNKGTAATPNWSTVKKVNGFVYFILFLFCSLPYTTRQANKTTLARRLSILLAQDPTLYQMRGCQTLCRKLHLQFPAGPGVNIPQAAALPSLRWNQENEERVRSYFKGKQVVFLSGTPSSTLLGIKALMVQGLPGQLMATMDLATHGIVPLAGTFGEGATGVEGFNKHAISGTDHVSKLRINWEYYAITGRCASLPMIKETELGTIVRYISSSSFFSPDTFLRTKAAAYRLKMLSLLEEGEVCKLVQSIRERLQAWQKAHPRVDHWDFNTAFLGQPIQQGSVQEELINLYSLQRGSVVVCTHGRRDCFGLVLSNSPTFKVLIDRETILTQDTTQVKSIVRKSLSPPTGDNPLLPSAAIVAKAKPYMTFEEEIEDLIGTLEGRNSVYRIDPTEFDEYAKTPFPLVFGSTDMKEKKLTPTSSHVTVEGGALLGEHLDFVLVRRADMEKVKTFFNKLDAALSEALPDEAPQLCLSNKLHIFPVEDFVTHYDLSYIS